MVRSKGKEMGWVNAGRMDCKQDGKTSRMEKQSCLALLDHPSLLMLWWWGTQFKGVNRQKMAEMTQLLLHSRDPGAIKLMRKCEFYLLFLGRELVGQEWALSVGNQFKSTGLLSVASCILSIIRCFSTLYKFNELLLRIFSWCFFPFYLFSALISSIYFIHVYHTI